MKYFKCYNRISFLIISILCSSALHAQKGLDRDSFIQKYKKYYEIVASGDSSVSIQLSNELLAEVLKNVKILEENYDDLSKMDKFQFANLLVKLKRFDRAKAIYDDLNGQYPKWGCPWHKKGYAFLAMGDSVSAIESLNHACKIKKKDVKLHASLAQLYLSSGAPKKGLNIFSIGYRNKGIDITDQDRPDLLKEHEILYLNLLAEGGVKQEYEKQVKRMVEKHPEGLKEK